MDSSPSVILFRDGFRKNQLMLNLTIEKVLLIDYVCFGCDRKLNPKYHNNKKIYNKVQGRSGFKLKARMSTGAQMASQKCLHHASMSSCFSPICLG